MKEEILEGLRYALAKGETLKYAMESFYNAGYERRDIEEAARELQTKMQPPPAVETNTGLQGKQKTQIQPVKKIPSKEKSTHEISNYEQPEKNPRKLIIIIIIILLMLLIIGLGIIFLFRESVVEFFNNLFG